jgi:hypothetical protein
MATANQMKRILNPKSRACAWLALAVIQSFCPAFADDSASPALVSPPEKPLVAHNEKGKIQFAETTHDFQKIIGGQSARHDFIFTNIGTSPLRIISVNPSCGCTTAADWTREVAPGGTGVIPLQFNSGSFSGAVAKSATVTSTDPETPSVILHIKGTVWRPIEVTPQNATLHLNSETVSNATAVVRIQNLAEQPLEVFSPTSDNPLYTAELRTNSPGKQFEVLVRSVPPLNFIRPHGTITLRTSATNSPVITFMAMGVVQPAVVTAPPRVIITESAFTNDWKTKISVRSGLNSPLKLSDAAINVPGATASIREVEPGRLFEVSLVIPTAAKDSYDNLQLTMKSNFSGFETVNVPIVIAAPNAVTASGIPLTSRASRFLNSPEGRKSLEVQPPKPEQFENAGGAKPAVPSPK